MLNATRHPGPACSQLNVYTSLAAPEYKNEHKLHGCQFNATTKGSHVLQFKLPLVHNSVQQSRCQVNDNFSTIVEYVSMKSPLDDKGYFTDKVGCHAGRIIRKTKAKTTQQFLFGEFLSDPRPDVIIILADAHDRSTVANYSIKIEQLLEIIHQYVLPPTRLIWLSRIAEDITRKPMPYREERFEKGAMSRLQYLNATNRIAYSKLGRRFVETGKPLLFLDLLEMTQPLLTEYNLDGVHMHDLWYESLMSYVAQTLCSTAADVASF